MVLSPPGAHAPFTPAPQFEACSMFIHIIHVCRCEDACSSDQLSQDAFLNVTAPRTPSFNRDPSKDPAKHWLMMAEPRHMSEHTVNKVDEVFRNR